MNHYAKGTKVAPEKTQAEIAVVLRRYGATDYMAGFRGNAAVVEFEMRGRHVRITVPMPNPQAKEFTVRLVRGSQVKADGQTATKAWEQAVREKWRALLLVLKGRLESIQTGIRTFDAEFLTDIVTSNGSTVGEIMLPRLDQFLNGQLALPAPIKEEVANDFREIQ